MPELVSCAAIRGVFHNHTTASDGRGSLGEMAEAAAGAGLELISAWLTIRRRAFRQRGLMMSGCSGQVDQIRGVQCIGQSCCSRVCRGSSGAIFCRMARWYLSDSTFWIRWTYAVMSVHSGFSQSEAEMNCPCDSGDLSIRRRERCWVTRRGGFCCAGREAYRIQLERKVIDACIANGVIVEINANHRGRP